MCTQNNVLSLATTACPHYVLIGCKTLENARESVTPLLWPFLRDDSDFLFLCDCVLFIFTPFIQLYTPEVGIDANDKFNNIILFKKH